MKYGVVGKVGFKTFLGHVVAVGGVPNPTVNDILVITWLIDRGPGSDSDPASIRRPSGDSTLSAFT